MSAYPDPPDTSSRGPLRPPLKPNGGYNQPETSLALPSKPAARREDKGLASTAGNHPKIARTQGPLQVLLNNGTRTRRSVPDLAQDETEAHRLARKFRSENPGAFAWISEIDDPGRPPRRPRWKNYEHSVGRGYGH
jgi:hypothetical protein